MTHKLFALRSPRPALTALALALLAVPAASLAQIPQGMPSDGVFRGFQSTGDYTLVVDGKPIPNAEIYLNDRIPALLILTSALPSPVLLSPGAGRAETVHIMKVSKQADGSVDLLADAVLAPLGGFELAGENVKFAYENRKVALNAKPPLLGLKTAVQLKTHSPDYARKAKAYVPNPQAIAALKKEAKPVTVRVFFGSWCSHCKQHVPYILRVEDELKGSGSKVKFEYLGLSREFTNPEAKKLGIKSVPTGVVFVNGKEVGRITGQGWNAPEVLLNRIVQNPAAKGK
jgi:thiol-disulfide isomerase/thioredoxin